MAEFDTEYWAVAEPDLDTGKPELISATAEFAHAVACYDPALFVSNPSAYLPVSPFCPASVVSP